MFFFFIFRVEPMVQKPSQLREKIFLMESLQCITSKTIQMLLARDRCLSNNLMLRYILNFLIFSSGELSMRNELNKYLARFTILSIFLQIKMILFKLEITEVTLKPKRIIQTGKNLLGKLNFFSSKTKRHFYFTNTGIDLCTKWWWFNNATFR